MGIGAVEAERAKSQPAPESKKVERKPKEEERQEASSTEPPARESGRSGVGENVNTVA